MRASKENAVNGLLFVPQKKDSSVDLVIENIKNLLLNGQLQPGDRLPTETELANAISVGRGSVREAMKILSAFGIVEIKQGDGTYISSSESKAMFDPLLFSLILTKSDVKAIIELREAIEFAIAKLIIENAGEEDIALIEECYEKQKSNTTVNDIGASWHYELLFHSALGQATKNRLIEKIYAFVMEYFTPNITKSYVNRIGNIPKALHYHENILYALKDRDLDKAISAIEDSIVDWQSTLKLED